MNIAPEIVAELKALYKTVQHEVNNRLDEFRNIYTQEDNEQVFRELCFCILSSGVGPKIAEKSILVLSDSLLNGPEYELTSLLMDTHKYPDRSSYLYSTREYLKENFNLNLISKLKSVEGFNERRDFMATNKNIRGIGYVQASHFLRNIGFNGYAILDKNTLRTLYELGITGDIKSPTSKARYLEKEDKMKEFSNELQISMDKLDLLLWYRRTNKIPR